MKKDFLTPLPKFFDRYINLCEDVDLVEGLTKFSPEALFKDLDFFEKIGDFTYQPNKWTVKQIIQHCIDTERIMAYRALCFARKDPNKLPGFEENDYAIQANVSQRTLKDLLEEFSLLRQSNILMFKNIDNSNLLNLGKANNSEICALHLGFVIIGHPIHHINIIKERYIV